MVVEKGDKDPRKPKRGSMTFRVKGEIPETRKTKSDSMTFCVKGGIPENQTEIASAINHNRKRVKAQTGLANCTCVVSRSHTAQKGEKG